MNKAEATAKAHELKESVNKLCEVVISMSEDDPTPPKVERPEFPRHETRKEMDVSPAVIEALADAFSRSEATFREENPALSPEQKAYWAALADDQYDEEEVVVLEAVIEEDETPLTEASRNGHIMIVEMLLENGADASDRALLLASREGHTDIVEMLLASEEDEEDEGWAWSDTDAKCIMLSALAFSVGLAAVFGSPWCAWGFAFVAFLMADAGEK